MANIVQKDRKAYRVWDKTNNEWNELNLKTTATSVDASDGDTLQTKVGAIKGVTTSTSVTTTGYAADATVVKELSNSLINENNESFNFGVKNGVRGFFTDPSRADDSFIPFISGGNFKLLAQQTPGTSLAFPENCAKAIVVFIHAYEKNNASYSDEITSVSVSNVDKVTEIYNQDKHPAMKICLVEGATTNSICTMNIPFSYTQTILIFAL